MESRREPTVWMVVSVLCIVDSYCINNRFSAVILMSLMGVLGLLLGGTMEKTCAARWLSPAEKGRSPA